MASVRRLHAATSTIVVGTTLAAVPLSLAGAADTGEGAHALAWRVGVNGTHQANMIQSTGCRHTAKGRAGPDRFFADAGRDRADGRKGIDVCRTERRVARERR